MQLSVDFLLVPICRELRVYCGIPSDDALISEQEIEFYWTLHDGIFYTAIRETIYKSPMQVAFDDKLRFAVDNFLAGAKTVYPKLVAEEARHALPAPAARRPKAARARAASNAQAKTVGPAGAGE